MRARSLGSGLGAIVVLAFGGAAIGRPDFAEAVAFFSGRSLSWPGAIAVVGLCVWLILLGVVLGLVITAARTVEARQRNPHRGGNDVILLLVAGLVVFGVGMVHHLEASAHQCCGSVQEAS